MSQQAHRIYRRAIRRNLKFYHANWLPGDPKKLGDYGVMKQGIFIKKGNIRDLGIQFEESPDPNSDFHSFNAGGSIDISSHAKGTIQNIVNASMEIKFKNAWSVFFHAADARTIRVKDKNALGVAILDFFKDNRDKWKRRYIVVTDLVTAGQTIAGVSSSANASLTIEASSPQIPVINLQDASIGVQFNKSSNVGYTVISKGMDVLMGLSKLQRKNFPQVMNINPANLGSASLNSLIQDDEDLFPASADELYFGQYTEDPEEDLGLDLLA